MGFGSPWRTGVAVLNYDNRPHDVGYPTFRPALLLREAGFEVHSVARGVEHSRVEADGTTAWVEPGTVAVGRRVLRLRPELLFVEGHSYGVLLGPMARRSWIRNPAPARRPTHVRIQRLALRAFDAVSFTNPFYEQRWSLQPGQLTELPHPIDVAWWAEPVRRRESWWTDRGLPAPRGPVLAYIANLVPLKRQVEVLAAVAPYLRANRDAVLLYVGHAFDTAVEAQLEQTRRRLGLTGQVYLTGGVSRDDVRDLLAWTTLTILNSETEMQAMIAFEALAAGVPTLVPAIPELLSLFPHLPAHRNGEELCAHVERLVTDAAVRYAAVEGSRDRLAWADVGRHDEFFLSTIERILGRPVG